jgi:hypothetical protein
MLPLFATRPAPLIPLLFTSNGCGTHIFAPATVYIQNEPFLSLPPWEYLFFLLYSHENRVLAGKSPPQKNLYKSAIQ